MQSFATNYISSGPLIILIMQSAIPVSMIISKFLLKVKSRCSPRCRTIPEFSWHFLQAKYEWQHYVGALIVIIGLLIVIIIPQVTQKGSGGGDTASVRLQRWEISPKILTIPGAEVVCRSDRFLHSHDTVFCVQREGEISANFLQSFNQISTHGLQKKFVKMRACCGRIIS
jgi:hypothetical protein